MEMTDEVSGQLVVACFLIREGAEVTALDNNGQTPLDACSPEMAVTVSAFSEKYAGYSHTHTRMHARAHTCTHTRTHTSLMLLQGYITSMIVES